jgi:hypothetical protein
MATRPRQKLESRGIRVFPTYDRIENAVKQAASNNKKARRRADIMTSPNITFLSVRAAHKRRAEGLLPSKNSVKIIEQCHAGDRGPRPQQRVHGLTTPAASAYAAAAHAVVYPQGVWLWRADAGGCREIMDTHIEGGEIAEKYRI